MWCRYEDVARDPSRELVNLCHFLNISVPPESQDFVSEHSSAEWANNRSCSTYIRVQIHLKDFPQKPRVIH